MSADYTEIVGRTYENGVESRQVSTRGVATDSDDTTRPRQGDTLSGTGWAIAPVCVSVRTDRDTYPQRTLFIARWVAPVLDSDVG